jgi:hypothetical protein
MKEKGKGISWGKWKKAKRIKLKKRW